MHLKVLVGPYRRWMTRSVVKGRVEGHDEPLERYPWRRHWGGESVLLVWRRGAGTHMRRQVFPQAPSPTMTSLRRISAILRNGVTMRAAGEVVEGGEVGGGERCVVSGDGDGVGVGVGGVGSGRERWCWTRSGQKGSRRWIEALPQLDG